MSNPDFAKENFAAGWTQIVDTEEAFNFYKSVFGGEFTMLQRFKDTPEGGKMSAGF